MGTRPRASRASTFRVLFLAAALAVIPTALDAQTGPPPYPGTGEDVELQTTVDRFGGPETMPLVPIKFVGGGDHVLLHWLSPNGTFHGGANELLVQLFPTGSPPSGPPQYPELHIDGNASPPPLILPSPMLPAQGEFVSGWVPLGFEGWSFMVQACALTQSAANGVFALTDAHELRIVALPGPTITAVSPPHGVTGATVSITGTGFLPGTTVSVDGVAATPTVSDATSLTFQVPPGAGCDTTVAVINPDLQTDSSVFNDSPSVTGLSGVIGSTAGGGMFVITGDGFHAGTTVTIGGNPATIVSQTATQLVVMPPPGLQGFAEVVIANPEGCSATTTYVYTQGLPHVVEVAPISGTAGTPITVLGDNLHTVIGVDISGTSVTPVEITPDRIVFLHPPGVACDSVLTISFANGLPFSMPFNPNLTITGTALSPGPVNGGFFFIFGTGFGENITVTIGSTEAIILTVGPQSIFMITPPGVSGSTVPVFVDSAGGCSAQTTYSYQ